jgi:hypothetical protein
MHIQNYLTVSARKEGKWALFAGFCIVACDAALFR